MIDSCAVVVGGGLTLGSGGGVWIAFGQEVMTCLTMMRMMMLP